MKHLRPNSRGFTFIEIIFIIAVTAILAAAAVYRISGGYGSALMAAEVLSSDIKATRWEAMKTGKRASLVFIGAGSYTYGASQPRDLSDIGGGIIVSGRSTVTFNSLGEPVGPASALVMNVSDADAAISVSIEPYTGKVTVQ